MWISENLILKIVQERKKVGGAVRLRWKLSEDMLRKANTRKNIPVWFMNHRFRWSVLCKLFANSSDK